MPTKTSGLDLLERLVKFAASAARSLAVWIERERQGLVASEGHDAIPISRATLRSVAAAPSGVGVLLTKAQIARARQIDEQAAIWLPASEKPRGAQVRRCRSEH